MTKLWTTHKAIAHGGSLASLSPLPSPSPGLEHTSSNHYKAGTLLVTSIVHKYVNGQGNDSGLFMDQWVDVCWEDSNPMGRIHVYEYQTI